MILVAAEPQNNETNRPTNKVGTLKYLATAKKITPTQTDRNRIAERRSDVSSNISSNASHIA
jgi:hypothetical protein